MMPFDRPPMTSYWRSIVTIWPCLVSFLRYSAIFLQIRNFLPPLPYLTPPGGEPRKIS